MIEFRSVSKTFDLDGGGKPVLSNVTARFPAGSVVGLLGRNGTGKSTVLKMIAGTMLPTTGEIVTSGAVSWPVGFAGSFHPDLTGLQNARFIARIYGVDTDELCDFVEDFAGLGQHFRFPLRTYSSGMKSRLAFGVSMGIGFEIYLIDEITAVGDAAFRENSMRYLRERLENAGAVMVTHSMPEVRRICTSVAVLERGRMRYFDDVDEGIAYHQQAMKQDA
ncbi:ABC transporter ATP-binding protein [Jannaschia aquimarina]|uniref:KpsT_2 protein n=1 Tax=Jannaschia aquimarina TaxID=935700 RepID=A0A0D1D6L8_9RHOB|nr:ABC transporter ATP-binding protein [Jannaschia aquimarina]KIT15618.1 Polysialic acid transport ATP-binding protein KpsT [Jannaschia aquimarina]SNT27800.1 capsular polysaccharide transport system ATP-binding protein [Jannaschia aquimarina]